MKEELLKQFQEWTSFLSSIEHADWNAPLDEGKWRIHDVVSHIYRWDQYFLEEAIIPISTDSPLTLKHIDFDEFNQKAMEKGKLQSKQEIVELSLHYRKAIIREIESQDDMKFNKEYSDGDGNKFVVESYVRDFIWHDRHHMQQIEERLKVMTSDEI